MKGAAMRTRRQRQRSIAWRPISGRSMRGQSLVEYLVVLMLFVLALTAGPHSPLEHLFEAFGDRYERFTHAMSLP